MSAAPVPAAAGIVFDRRHRLLVVRRGRPPAAGLWSVPGGKCRPGETPEAACIRELREETGLRVAVERLAGVVTVPHPGHPDFEIHDFVCRILGGRARAGDDAADVRWVDAAELAELPTTPGLIAALRAWDAIPS